MIDSRTGRDRPLRHLFLQRYTAGRELEIERAFLADADKTDLSAWLYNGAGIPERLGRASAPGGQVAISGRESPVKGVCRH